MRGDIARILRRVEGKVHAFNVYALNAIDIAENLACPARNAKAPPAFADEAFSIASTIYQVFEAW
jgi:hypothetical protein